MSQEMRKLLCLAIIVISLVSLYPGLAQAQSRVGVEVIPAIIRVEEPLIPGKGYSLPSIEVVNLGDVGGDYEVTLIRMEQVELQPSEEFLSLSPRSFHLEPQASQEVALNLSIPAGAELGDYLGYIEAHTVSQGEGTIIGIAAATKLYFTVEPNPGVFGSIANFFSSWAPFSYIVLGLMILGITLLLLHRYLGLELKVNRKGMK